MKQLSDIKLAMNDIIQNRTPNFKFKVTRYLWKKIEKPSLITHGKIWIFRIKICISA